MTQKFEIRNSTAEFLTFVARNKEDGVEVMYADKEHMGFTTWVY